VNPTSWSALLREIPACAGMTGVCGNHVVHARRAVVLRVLGGAREEVT
jgi:hypothetical protein